MLAIIADGADLVADALAARWRQRTSADVALLTPADLSRRGWRYRLGTGAGPAGAAIIADRIVPVEEIDGVLTRLPSVSPHHLPHIIPADREYVAAEMTAFLTAWLSGLTCPVLNRPTPGCLTGPAWRPQHWAHLAAQLAIPTQQAADVDAEVTVVDEHCFGPDGLCVPARRLAAAG